MKKILLISLTTLLSFKGFAAAIYLPEFCDPLVWQTTQELRAALIGEDLREEAPEDAFAEANPEEVNPDFAGFVARGVIFISSETTLVVTTKALGARALFYELGTYSFLFVMLDKTVPKP